MPSTQSCKYCSREAQYTSIDERLWVVVVCGECEMTKEMRRVKALDERQQTQSLKAPGPWWQNYKTLAAVDVNLQARQQVIEQRHDLMTCDFCGGDDTRVQRCPTAFEELLMFDVDELDRLTGKSTDNSLFTNNKIHDMINTTPREVKRMPRVQSGFSNLQQRQERDSKNRLSGDFISYLRLGR